MRMMRETTLVASQDIQGATTTEIAGTEAVKKIKVIGHIRKSPQTERTGDIEAILDPDHGHDPGHHVQMPAVRDADIEKDHILPEIRHDGPGPINPLPDPRSLLDGTHAQHL
jgi:hypothetical protein